MDATTMPSLTSLVANLKKDYPHLSFVQSDKFLWSPADQSVHYISSVTAADAQLLHELSHGILKHSQYGKDIELIIMERQAWAKAKELADHYSVSIGESIIEDHLDTYREWMHVRSSCPSCGATGVETKKYLYHCVACLTDWKVNEARICGLKRYKVTK